MPPRVLVWLSWWVDSAVAAHLLLEQWYEVIAGFMKNYADPSNPDCHTRQDRDMALKVAHFLWIETFVIFDFRTHYHEKIIQYIYDTYEAWLTPNPDILCNTEVKFKLFLEKARDVWCDYVATGHYVRKTSHDGSYSLLKGKDDNKDQSYFLSWLNQYQLEHALFPLGGLTKPQVREIAKNINLPNAERKDSQGLCFIGKVDMKTFLQEALPTKHWDIIDEKGAVLWTHTWVHFYTIGQRQGLGLAWGPWYVIHKDTQSNTLVVGKKDATALYHSALIASKLHRVMWSIPTLPCTLHAKIRYRQADQACTIARFTNEQQSNKKDNLSLIVNFKTPQRAISPGQTIAFYDWDSLIWSGIIQNAYSSQ